MKQQNRDLVLKTLSVMLSLGCVCANAADYVWKSAASGNWREPANWNPSTGYPGSADDTATFPAGSYTVTLDTDLTIGGFGDFNQAAVVFELSGQKLTVVQNAKKGMVAPYAAEKDLQPLATPTFRNGEVKFEGSKGFQIGYNGMTYAGGFTLDGAVTDMKIDSGYFCGAPRITISNGGVWNYPDDFLWEYSQKGASYGFIRVTGPGSNLKVDSPSDKNMSSSFNGYESGIYVQDGATADFLTRVAVGGSDRLGEHQDFSTNSFIEVENATLNVSQDLIFGGYYHYGYVEHDLQSGPTLRVKGTNSVVAIGEKLYLYEDVGAKFEYEVPAGGWTTAPVTAKELVVMPRGAGLSCSGVTTNRILALQWMVRHPNETVPLLTLETANAEALAAFAAHAVVDDYSSAIFTSEPVVSVSADGKTLFLTAPGGVYEETLIPVAALSRTPISASEESVTMTFSSFGLGCDALQAASVALYSDAGMTGEPLEVKSLDVASLTDPTAAVPLTFTGLTPRTVYYVRATVTNVWGYACADTTSFATAGATGSSYVWAGGTGVWDRVASWTANSGYPTIGDEVSLTDEAYVTLEENARIRRFNGVGPWSCPVVDLGGNTLETDAETDIEKEIQLTGYDYATEEDLRPLVPSFTVRNGTFAGGTFFVTHNGDRPGTGSIIFDNCTYEGKLVKKVANGFRCFIQNGAKVTLPKSVEDFRWLQDSSGYGFICVRGAGSSLASTFDNLGKSPFIIDGFHNGLYVQDGATATIVTSLTIGYRPASTNSFIEVDDATLNAKYALAFGVMNSWGTWEECENAKEPTLRIKGSHAKVNVGTSLLIVDGLAARIAYTVPTDGFAAVPLTAATLDLRERTSGRPNVGPSGLVVNARNWKKAHPCETQTLLSLTTANPTGLQRLVDHSEVKGSGCTLAVTADGRSIVLTASVRRGSCIILPASH